jgi:hypothetical protein
MTKPQEFDEEWIPCPPGILSSLASLERVRQRRKFLILAGSSIGVLASASGAVWLALRDHESTWEPTFGGIACSKVRKLAPLFQTAQLDEVVIQQIKTHLEKCPECRKLLESTRIKAAARLQHREQAESCRCATCHRDIWERIV